jgi:WhiB family redox-sensing transcriptional regulator
MAVDMFFPERGEYVDAAKAVCSHCPVRQTCLEYAISTNERWGIWGGTSERERRPLRLSWTGTRHTLTQSPFRIDQRAG